MLTLAFTSSTGQVGVALADDDQVVASAVSSDDRRHAEDITRLMVAVLDSAGAELGEVDRLGVDVGPGRFTGLRVGLATVRALSLATGCGVVGVTSLELLAAAETDGHVVSVVDARRHEVFQQAFSSGVAVSEAVVGEPAALLPLALADAVIVGDGADRYAELYGSAGRHLTGREPSPEVLARLAAARPSRPGAEVAPRYLRDPDVQVNIRTRP